MIKATRSGLDPVLRAVLSGWFGGAGIEAARIDAGVHSGYTGTITAGTQKVFCKAVSTQDTRLARMLGQEAAITPLLGALAPSLLGDIEADGWRVLLFEHLPGSHADLAPGGTGLTVLTELVDHLHEATAAVPTGGVPDLAEQWRRASPWRRLFAEPPGGLQPAVAALLDPAARTEEDRLALLDGHHLAHTDLHSLNMLTNGHTIRVVDWAWARTAPPWWDAVMLAIRLIEAGHTPQQAHAWLHTTTPAAHLPDHTLHAITTQAIGMWTWLAAHDTRRPHLNDLANAGMALLRHTENAA
ncbi:hypothetical protein AB0I28_19790 [Phytomonospora sp. NPDC050363]|uniref:phosphotransferase family protein n=1 Tax=Phytomonospora sp. NPDC050363 TaxID=3155642 RepID=UPI0033E1A840